MSIFCHLINFWILFCTCNFEKHTCSISFQIGKCNKCILLPILECLVIFFKAYLLVFHCKILFILVCLWCQFLSVIFWNLPLQTLVIEFLYDFYQQAEKLMIMYEETRRTRNMNMNHPPNNSRQNSSNHDRNLFEPPNEEHGTPDYGIVVSNQICSMDKNNGVSVEFELDDHQPTTDSQGQNLTYNKDTAMEALDYFEESKEKLKAEHPKALSNPFQYVSKDSASPLFEQFGLSPVQNIETCEHVWNILDPPSTCKRHLLNGMEGELQSKRSRILVTV